LEKKSNPKESKELTKAMALENKTYEIFVFRASPTVIPVGIYLALSHATTILN